MIVSQQATVAVAHSKSLQTQHSTEANFAANRQSLPVCCGLHQHIHCEQNHALFTLHCCCVIWCMCKAQHAKLLGALAAQQLQCRNGIWAVIISRSVLFSQQSSTTPTGTKSCDLMCIYCLLLLLSLLLCTAAGVSDDGDDDAGFEQQLARLAAGSKAAALKTAPPPSTGIGLGAADITPETMKVCAYETSGTGATDCSCSGVSGL